MDGYVGGWGTMYVIVNTTQNENGGRGSSWKYHASREEGEVRETDSRTR